MVQRKRARRPGTIERESVRVRGRRALIRLNRAIPPANVDVAFVTKVTIRFLPVAAPEKHRPYATSGQHLLVQTGVR
jgi:hypothetical protein